MNYADPPMEHTPKQLSIAVYQGTGNYIFDEKAAFITEKTYDTYLGSLDIQYGNDDYLVKLSSPSYHLVFEDELYKKYTMKEISYRFEGRNLTDFNQKVEEIVNILMYALVIIIVISLLICYITNKKYYDQVQLDMVNIYLHGVSRRKIKSFLYSNIAYISASNIVLALGIYGTLVVIDDAKRYRIAFLISYVVMVICNYVIFALMTMFIFKKSFSMTHSMNHLRK